MCIFLTKEEMHCVNGEVWEILQGALKYGENNRFAHVGLELSGHRQANLLVSGEGSAGVAGARFSFCAARGYNLIKMFMVFLF